MKISELRWLGATPAWFGGFDLHLPEDDKAFVVNHITGQRAKVSRSEKGVFYWWGAHSLPRVEVSEPELGALLADCETDLNAVPDRLCTPDELLERHARRERQRVEEAARAERDRAELQVRFEARKSPDPNGVLAAALPGLEWDFDRFGDDYKSFTFVKSGPQGDQQVVLFNEDTLTYDIVEPIDGEKIYSGISEGTLAELLRQSRNVKL